MGLVAGLTDFHPKIKTTPPPPTVISTFSPGRTGFAGGWMCGHGAHTYFMEAVMPDVLDFDEMYNYPASFFAGDTGEDEEYADVDWDDPVNMPSFWDCV